MRASTILRICPTLVLICLHDPAKADFSLLPTEQGPVSSATTPTEAPQRPPTPTRPATSPSKKTKIDHSTPKRPLARGFGTAIPLSFAVRQIVPAPIKVSFTHEADRNAIVDWRGGRAWPSVLRDAIRPLGLRAIVRERVVSITHR
ncbi:hypothetical protein [Methylosinus sp. C49]|uniref:hypothetical protein n=1 Tax=Methylosinus sp. C49 TaxID=2699395 RepID=UPI00137ADF8B|nr:hypothetical protein [Methylosinus sp. C49]